MIKTIKTIFFVKSRFEVHMYAYESSSKDLEKLHSVSCNKQRYNMLDQISMLETLNAKLT